MMRRSDHARHALEEAALRHAMGGPAELLLAASRRLLAELLREAEAGEPLFENADSAQTVTDVRCLGLGEAA